MQGEVVIGLPAKEPDPLVVKLIVPVGVVAPVVDVSVTVTLQIVTWPSPMLDGAQTTVVLVECMVTIMLKVFDRASCVGSVDGLLNSPVMA